MVLAAHQPQYLAWLGLFHKIARCDVFVFLDNVQYKKREFQNRNKIRTQEGSMWLTVPVNTKGRQTQRLREVRIDAARTWQKDHWRAIQFNYARAKEFAKYAPALEDMYMRQWEWLVELNVALMERCLAWLGIERRIEWESRLGIQTTRSQRLVDVCRALKAETYLSGVGGHGYVDEDLFHEANIKVEYQQFDHPMYPQVYPGFESNLSAIDALFNVGEEAKTWFQ